MFSNNLEWYYQVWSWIGLGGAIVLLVLLFTTNVLRTNLNKSRWRDPVWLAWLANTCYLLHNVEEYGIDLQGTMYAFPKTMETLVGNLPGGLFFVAVNITLFWIVGPITAILSKKYPIMATGMASFMFINGLIHILSTVAGQSYNPGVLTSVLLFIPISIWIFYINFGKNKLKFSILGIMLGIGLLSHIGLFGTILGLFKTGIAGTNVAAFLQLLNGGLTLLLWYLAGKHIKTAK